MKKFDTQSTMRLMTWNIWHHFGPWQERQTAIEHVIEAENPDVRTTDDHFLMEVSVHDNEAELVKFFEGTGAVEVKVIDKH